MRTLTVKEAIYEAIEEEMNSDKSVVLCGFGVGNIPFRGEKDSRRIVDLAENSSSAVRTALGIAMTGAKVILYIRGEFLLRCMEAMVDIAFEEYASAGQYGSNVTVIADTGFAPYQAPQLNVAFEAAFASIPGLVVAYPSNAFEVKGVLKNAVKEPSPALVLYAKASEGYELELHEDISYDIPVGKAVKLMDGDDVTIVTYGATSFLSVMAARKAGEEGINCDIIDLCTISPFDKDSIDASLKKTNKIMIVHEAREAFGAGAEIAAYIASSDMLYYLDKPIRRVCAADEPIGFSRADYDNKTVTEEKILDAIRHLAMKEE